MSSFFKTGLVSVNSVNSFNSEPFILDTSKRVAEIDNNAKIIRPLEEKTESEEVENDNQEFQELQNQELLDGAMELAESMRQEAVSNANDIISKAEAEAEEIKENAYKEGYEKGLEDGGMEAARRGDEYLANLQREHDQLMERINEEADLKIAETEKELIDFACSMIEKFTGILVEDYKPVMIYMINNALAEEEASTKFVIKVSEDNYSYVYENRERITGATNPNIQIEIFGDPKLEARQCIIESDNGIIDLSMNMQMRNLATAIKLITQ